MTNGSEADGPQVALSEGGPVGASPDPELERWLALVQRLTQATSVTIALSDGARQKLRGLRVDGAGSQLWASELLREDSLEQHVRRSGGQGPVDMRGVFTTAPIEVRGQDLGQVAIADPSRSGWSADDLATLIDAAAGISSELDGRIAKAEVARIQQLLVSHNGVHHMIGRGAPLHEVLTEVCQIIERYDPSLMASVLQRDAISNTLHSGIGPSFPKLYLDSIEGAPIGPGIGTCGPAAWFGQFTVSTDLRRDPNWDPIRALVDMAGVAHCWSMPIMDSAGEVLGTLAFYGRQPRAPRPEHAALIQDWARVAGAAIERAKSMGRLKHDARHDSLTGLPNRAAIFERLESAIQHLESGSALAVLFVDLDGLKAMNDTLGHGVADEMIREVALRLSKCVREEDLVGRIGGDEFIVVAESVGDAAQARELGARLLESIAQPLPGLQSRVVTASIGITLVCGSDIDAREAIRRADAAMYEAKRAGRDRCVFSEIGESAPAGRRLQMARELRGAENRGELRLVYQPVMALPSREIVGVESLLRWISPTFGEVMPAEFIPIAEDTGSILQIGAWVLRESCEALAKLASEGHRLELGVNVSARQVSQRNFPLWVRQTLAHARFPADKLCLELTETSLLRQDSVTLGNLSELDALGVGLALDDFGTGCSSLIWLRDHPFSAIKIAHGFISGVHDRAVDRTIVAGVIRLANDLGRTVTAEGVQTAAQLRILQALGCDRAQGFAIAPPVSAEQLMGLLKRPSVRDAAVEQAAPMA
jgi:diguanylate cyclase (GGDEF)-like protein